MSASSRAGKSEFFSATVGRCGSVVSVNLIGELDLFGADALADLVEALLGSGPELSEVVLDARRLSFADLLGVRALADACRRLAWAGALVEVANVPPSVGRVIDLSGVDVPVADEAVSSVVPFRPTCSVRHLTGSGRGRRRRRYGHRGT